MLDKLWIEIGEAGKVILVKIHHEHFVRGGQIHGLAGKLAVKVGNVLAMPLKIFFPKLKFMKFKYSDNDSISMFQK